MKKYSIASIPTEFKGRRYRSRLEARWAAFFDLLGWQHEYEPFDLGKWSPDFLIRLPQETGCEVLVEVKPVSSVDEDVCTRMQEACLEKRVYDIEGRVVSAVLVGISPFLDVKRNYVRFGWALPFIPLWEPGEELEANPREVVLGWLCKSKQPGFMAEIVSGGGRGWLGLLTGLVDFPPERRRVPPFLYPGHTMELWAKASNRVQWKPSREFLDRDDPATIS